jgi:hypothetical protein
MTDRRTNEERRRLIADAGGALEPHEEEELPLLADVLADSSTWAEPSARLEDAVVQAVTDSEPTTTKPVTPVATITRRDKRTRWVLVSAVAAATVIAIVVATVLVTGGGPGADYQAQLHGTGSAPGADASVEITRTDGGFRITLDAEGLPALRAGDYYQAWLKSPTGALVPIGTFSSSDERVTLWSGVSPRDFPTVTVTVEATDGDQTSSGRRVLEGETRVAVRSR